MEPPNPTHPGRRCREALSAVSRGLLGVMRAKHSGPSGVQKRVSRQQSRTVPLFVVLAVEALQQQRQRQLLRAWRGKCQRAVLPTPPALEGAVVPAPAAVVSAAGAAGTSVQAVRGSPTP